MLWKNTTLSSFYNEISSFLYLTHEAVPVETSNDAVRTLVWPHVYNTFFEVVFQDSFLKNMKNNFPVGF